MASVLIHDGRRTGHLGWSVNAVREGVASGVFISPFCTPRIGASRSPSGDVFAQAVRDVGGEVIFDVETHARLLPGSDRLEHYEGWELWGGVGINLDSQATRLEHVERVFERQTSLGAMLLAPTQLIDVPDGIGARNAFATAEIAAGLVPHAGQSLVGARGFWSSGHRLDAYIGQLASLNSPVWIVTLFNDLVTGPSPDLGDTAAIQGILRSIHSLSERSRVILNHSDFAGLLAVAAGAEGIGAGWDRSMRLFDPSSFHVSSDPGPRIPASLVTQAGLAAVLRRDVAEAITRWNGARADTIRGGAMPVSDKAERSHHLASLRTLARHIDDAPNRLERVARLRSHYESADRVFDELTAAVPSAVRSQDKAIWVTQQRAALSAYATDEGLWVP